MFTLISTTNCTPRRSVAVEIFYFCLFLGSIDDHFTIYSRTYLIFLTLHDIMQFYTIYRNNTKAKIKIKEVYTTNDKYCNQSQNRLNLNILLRDHEYPAYFLIDYTFLGCVHICKLCLFRIGCEVISSIFTL